MKLNFILTGVLLYYGLSISTVNADKMGIFAVASVHFEQNATDGDVEVVFKIKGGDEGITKLNVISPDGRTVIDFTAPDVSTLGIRQFVFESPEPKNLESLKMAYPEGDYTFTGTTFSGERLHGKAVLHHKLPATVNFIRPEANALDVRFEELRILWSPVSNVSAYVIEISQNDLDMNLIAKLSGSSTSFKLPNEYLLPGTEYTLSIGTISEKGNKSFVETDFKTSEKRKSH